MTIALAAALAMGAMSAAPVAVPEPRVTRSWPAQPQGQRIDVDALMGLAEIDGHDGELSLSPDGRWLAFQVRRADVPGNRYRSRWVVLPLAGGQPYEFDAGHWRTHGGGSGNGLQVKVDAQWSPDSRRLAFVKKTPDGSQVWTWRPGGDAEQTTHSRGDVLSLAWSPDGDKLYYTRTRDRDTLEAEAQQRRDTGTLWDLDFQPGQKLSAETRWRDDGLWVFDGTDRPATPEEKAEYERSTGKAVPAEAKAASRTGYGDPFAAWDGARRRLAWVEPLSAAVANAATPRQRIKAMPAPGQVRTCKDDGCEGLIRNLWWRPDSDEIVFRRAEGASGEIAELHAWNVATGRVRLILGTTDALGAGCVPGAAFLFCVRESPLQPRQVVRIGLEDGVVEVLYDPNPQFAALQRPRVDRIEWRDRFGNATFGHLVYPYDYEPGQRYPLVVTQYRSRRFMRGGIGGEYPVFAFAAKGMFVLDWDRPEFRDLRERLPIADVYREIWGKQDGQRLAKDDQALIDAAGRIFDHLVAEGLVDRERIAMTGLSNGAGTTWQFLKETDELAAAIVSQGDGGVMAPYLFSRRDMDARSDMFFGWDAFKALAAGNQGDTVHAPVLLNLSDSEALWAATRVGELHMARRPFEAWVYRDEQHIKAQPHHLHAILTRNLDWLDFWLNGHEDSDPVKAEQYRRWRELREMRKPD